MARRRRSRKLGSMVLGRVKVCKMKGKKLVCKTMKRASRKSMAGLGASCRTAKGKFKKC
jgi:hypothetical protein